MMSLVYLCLDTRIPDDAGPEVSRRVAPLFGFTRHSDFFLSYKIIIVNNFDALWAAILRHHTEIYKFLPPCGANGIYSDSPAGRAR